MMKIPKQCQELTLTVPWGHVAAKAWGSQNNERVLLLHGTLDNVGSFSRLVELLPENYYYVAIDLPGHGLSSHLPPGVILDFFTLILGIKYVLDELQWNQCVFIGHSLGAQLSIVFSIVFPNRSTKIIALDGMLPTPVSDENLLPRIKEVNETVLFDSNKKAPPLYTKTEILESLKTRRQFSLNEEAAEAIFERSVTKIDNLYKYNRDLRVRLFIRPNMNFDQYRELMKHYSVPLLIILASQSWMEMNQENSMYWKKFKQILPHSARIVTVEGNHDVHNNNPERVAPHICSFLNNTISKL